MIQLILYLVIIFFLLVILVFERQLKIIAIDSNSYIKHNLNNKFRRKTSLFIILLLTLILSIYSTYLASTGILVDTIRYSWSFNYRYPTYSNSLEDMLNAKTEVGFLYLNKVIYIFTDNSIWLFFCCAFISTSLTFYVASKINGYLINFVMLYMMSQYYLFTTYTLKQALAVSFANLAIYQLFKNRNLLFIIYTAIAISFHTSSLVLFIYYILTKIIKTRRSYIYILIGTPLLALSMGLLMNFVLPNIPFFSSYIFSEDQLNQQIEGYGVIFRGLPFYILSVYLLIYRNRLATKFKHIDKYIIACLLFSMSWILAVQYYWILRFCWYFALLTLSSVPLLLKEISNKNGKIVFIFLFFTPLIVLTIRQVYLILS